MILIDYTAFFLSLIIVPMVAALLAVKYLAKLGEKKDDDEDDEQWPTLA